MSVVGQFEGVAASLPRHMAANSALASSADASAFIAPFPLGRTGMPPLRAFRGVLQQPFIPLVILSGAKDPRICLWLEIYQMLRSFAPLRMTAGGHGPHPVKKKTSRKKEKELRASNFPNTTETDVVVAVARLVAVSGSELAFRGNGWGSENLRANA